MSSRIEDRRRGPVLPLLTVLALATASPLYAQTQPSAPQVQPEPPRVQPAAPEPRPRTPEATAPSQPRADIDDSQTPRPKPADRNRLTQMVKEALPSWNEKLLEPPKTKNWAENLTPLEIAEAVDDRELRAVIKKAPNGVQLFQTKASVLRFSPDTGELRYVNRARTVDLRNDVGELPAAEKAQEIALSTLARLGLPREEFVDLTVATQVAGGAPIEAREMQVKTELYRLITVPRRVGELPVFVSRARAAVDPQGQIQRLRISWPPITLERNLRLAEPDKIVERAVDVLVDQDASEEVRIRARLGYLPIDPRNPTAVVPVVLFSVLDPPTPFMFSVPVAEPEESDDK